MDNKKPARKGPNQPAEKPKNFKVAISRLISELKPFHVLIIIALVLAGLSSVLSILSPNKLSELTDTISEGLIINSDNLEEITAKVMDNFRNEDFKKNIGEILNININQEKINTILSDDGISLEEKGNFQNFLLEMQNGNTEALLENLGNLSNSILEKLFTTSVYKEVEITREDKIKLLNSIAVISEDMENVDLSKLEITDNVAGVLLEDIEVEKKIITSSEQIQFLEVMGNISKEENSSNIYKEMDNLPSNIRMLIEPKMNMDKVLKVALFLASLYVISAIFNYIESISMTIVSNKFANKLRANISRKINKLPLQYFDNHVTGDTLSRVTNDVDTIAQSMNQSLSTLVSAVTLFVGTIIMMFVTNWIMAITAILSSLFGFIFMFSVLGKSQKYFVSRQVELGNLNGHIEEVYSGLNVVKAYNGRKQALEKFDEYNMKVYNANKKSQFLSGLMMPMMSFIGNFGYVCVCIVGALLTMNGMISFGVIVAFITYVRLFTSPLSQIAQAMTSLQSTAAASERVFEFLDEEEMKSEENISNKLDIKKVRGKIEFKDVSFTYAGNDTPTIKNFSAVAQPGQKIAIVGPTGAGKTTMVNLLMKFYDITKGEILIDGVATSKLSRENIHDLFTMVLQDTWLFNGTLKENIVYNRENISDERIEEVSKIVGLDHFIKTLPQGYDTVISDNDSVSAGQRQLMTIARGMLKDAPFLILDEATSNVDTRTEELVQKAMDKLTEGRTSFIIAHRLSTIKNADLILVMKDGNIIETGNHNELMKKNGFYADLYNSQFEL